MNRSASTLVSVVFVVLVGGCGKGSGSSSSGSPALAISASPLVIRPDGSSSDLRLYVSHRVNGVATVTAPCGVLGTTSAPVGTAVQLCNGTAVIGYSCDAATSSCCTDGLAVTVSAAMGNLTVTQVITLDANAPDSTATGGPGGGCGGGNGGGGGGGGTGNTFAFDVTLSPGGIALWDKNGIARIEALDHPAVGFGLPVYTRGYISEAGNYFYLENESPYTLRRFVRDSFWRYSSSSPWSWPLHAVDNDPVITTPACTAGTGRFLLRQGSEDFLYGCPEVVLGPTYDMQGRQRVAANSAPLSWNANDAILVIDDTRALSVIGTDGVQRSVSAALTPTAFQARAHLDGFWLVGGPEPLHRWFISSMGEATDEGAFAASPAGYEANMEGVMDDTGTLHQIAFRPVNGTIYGAIIRRPLEPAQSDVLHDCVSDPAWNWSTTPPTTPMSITSTARYLVTGP